GGQPGNDIQVEVAEASQPAEDTFKLVITRGKDREEHDNVTTKKGKNNVITAVKAASKLIQLEEIGTAGALEKVPAPGKVTLQGGGASMPARVTPDEYVGDSADRTGFAGLEAIDTVTMPRVPDHMAGIWARSDDTRGVHKAPANEVVRGAISLELQVTKSEHDLLNPQGVNVIRAFPGRGIRVWGARTLSSDPAWRYINVRRLFNYIEGSILLGTQWVVFEPNDMALWERVKRTISAFLVRVWRDGALFGATPGEAFYVKCDGENNTAETIDAGQLIVEIGIAPVKPAEFVVFKIAQFSGGTSLSE